MKLRLTVIASLLFVAGCSDQVPAKVARGTMHLVTLGHVPASKPTSKKEEAAPAPVAAPAPAPVVVTAPPAEVVDRPVYIPYVPPAAPVVVAPVVAPVAKPNGRPTYITPKPAVKPAPKPVAVPKPTPVVVAPVVAPKPAPAPVVVPKPSPAPVVEPEPVAIEDVTYDEDLPIEEVIAEAFAELEAEREAAEENEEVQIVGSVDFDPGIRPGGVGWSDSYSFVGGDRCWIRSNFDHGLNSVSAETPYGPMMVPSIAQLLGDGPGIYKGGTKDLKDDVILFNDAQCGNGPPNSAWDEQPGACPGRVDMGPGEGCGITGPKWNFEAE